MDCLEPVYIIVKFVKSSTPDAAGELQNAMIRRVKQPKRKPSLSLLVVGLLCLLLPVFAYFQYDWLGKVSEGEREQMKANLERSAAQFAESFDREIARVYTAFQSQPHDSVEAALDDYAVHYDHWLDVAPIPELIAGIYIATAEEGGAGLERFNPKTRRFEAIAWPPELSKYRVNLGVEKRQTRGNMQVFVRSVPRSVDTDIPALIIPFSQERFAAPPFSEDRFVGAGPLEIINPRAYLIVKLDLDVIRTRLLPPLIETHFAAGGVSDYHIAIFDEVRSTPIFSTSEPSSATGDVTASFFALRFPEIHWIRPRGILSATNREITARETTVVSKALQLRLLEGQDDRREVAGTFVAGPVGGWKLVATHRAGSLDAAVAQLRRRNLGISGGILMLLGGSVVMMLFSSRRAQRLARQQIEFVSAVSHELRTPLAVICSAGENLADGVVENSDQTRQYGAVVRNEGRRLSEMVEQILDFAGMEAGRKSYKMRPVEIADVVRAATDACKVQIQEKGFVLETHLDVQGALIMADPSALARALQNLVSNALKYSDKTRWIAIRAGLSTVKMWITVEDKGIGIPPSDLPHIFEPFYRSREVVDAQINGSGLGLSLVKQIVEAHGGSVDAASVRGRGTTFKILLPVCPMLEANGGD